MGVGSALFLLFFASTSSGSTSSPSCCPYKRVGGVGYSLLGSGPVPAACASGCTYSRDGQPGGATYCFAPGDLQVECSATNSIAEEIRQIARIKVAAVKRAEEVSASMTHLLDMLQPENSNRETTEFPDSRACSNIYTMMAQQTHNFTTTEPSNMRALTDSLKRFGEIDPQCTDNEKEKLIKQALETREKSESIITELELAVTDFDKSTFETEHTRFDFDTRDAKGSISISILVQSRNPSYIT